MKRHKREGGLRAPAGPAILVLAMAAMSAAVAQQKTTVVLGTATQGGGFQIYGAAYSAALNESDPTLVVEQRSTKGSTENAPLLAEGKIDIGLATGEVTYEALVGIARWPGFGAIARRPAGARFITPTPEELKRVLAKYAFIKPITLPAGSYKGQNAPVAALGSWSLVLARPGLPDEAAYKLARALHKGEAALGAKLEQAKASTLANTLASAPRQDLIHPGVLKYMREAGILR